MRAPPLRGARSRRAGGADLTDLTDAERCPTCGPVRRPAHCRGAGSVALRCVAAASDAGVLPDRGEEHLARLRDHAPVLDLPGLSRISAAGRVIVEAGERADAARAE